MIRNVKDYEKIDLEQAIDDYAKGVSVYYKRFGSYIKINPLSSKKLAVLLRDNKENLWSEK